MKEYIVNGEGYRVEAEDLDEFLETYPNAVERAVQPGKTTSSAGVIPTGGPNNMGLNLGDGSSGQQEISPWQNFKNNISNAFEMVEDVPEFYGIGTGDKSVEEVADEGGLGAYSGLSIASTLIYESVFGKEKVKEMAMENPGFWANFASSDSEKFQKVIKNFEIEKKDQKRTMTFKEADSFGDYLSVVGGSIANVGGSVAYNLGTFGTGFFMDFASDNFITANKEKAKANNTTLEELVKSGDHDVSAPFKIAAFQAGLEYFGFSKIVGKTGAGKTINKKVGEFLTKNYKKSKNIRTGLDILGTGRVEAFTEMGQTGLEIYNKELAIAKGKGEDINDLMSITKGMFSEEGIEAGLQGFFGGSGLKAGSYSAKALSNIRKSEKNLDVEADLSKLVELKKVYNSSTDDDVKFALDKEIKKTEASIKDKVKKGNDIYNSLSDGDIKKIEKLSELSDVTAFRANNLIEKFKNGEIKEDDFNVAINGLSNTYKENKQKIIETLYKKNIEFAKAEGEKIGKDIVEVESIEDFQKKYEEVRTEGDFEGDVTGNDGFIKGDNIYINKQVALKEGAISVGSHEILHGIIGKSFDKLSTKDKAKLGKSFIGFLNKDQEAAVRKRLKDSYNLEGDAIFGTEEIFTAFSDAINKEEITFNEGVFQKIGLAIQELMNKLIPGYRKEFSNGRQAYDFLKEYQKNVKEGKLGQRAVTFAEQDRDVDLAKFKAKSSVSKDQTDSVNELAEMGWTDKTWKESGADFAIKEMQSNKMLDGLIRSKYKADVVPDNFVDLVYSELVNHVKNFKPEQNNNLFGWVNSQISNKAGNVYNREFKVADEMKGAKDIGKTTKEGEVKIQVAAEKSSELEAFEEEDLSIQGQAKKAKADKQQYSEYRRKLGFKEGDKIYNEVLENVKKSLMIAYGTTQNITDVQLRAQAVAAKLKKEYANLNSPLFKQIKNFLTYGVADTKVPYGTKDIYISQLKKLREDIVKNTSTADLVQMERNTPEADRVFTDFVKVLTSVQQVQDAVNKEQLPPDALNKITKDKKTGKGAFSPSLYNKVMPTETELVSWADQPGINPVTGLRQGLKGTRKDGLAMRMVNSLVTDAIMEARQSDQVQDRIAGMEIDPGSVAELGAAIGREVNIKFSKSNAIEDISVAMDGSGSVKVYSQIKFSKSHREAYEKQLAKRRPDLTEKQRKVAVQSVFDFVDGKEIPNNKKSKYEKMAMHYTANGFLILPEDGYKVIEAEKIATQKKLDPFSFKNPNVLIETYVGEVKGTRTNPDDVKTFTNKTELTSGVTVYDVEDSKQGQLDTRKVIDTHFGEKSNPWCLCARQKVNEYSSELYISSAEANNRQDANKIANKAKKEGNNAVVERSGDKFIITTFAKIEGKDDLNLAFTHWKTYNKDGNGHQIAFQNGRLVSFRDGNEMRWWDRNDKPSNAVVIRGKKGKDGFKPVIEVSKTKETILNYEKVTGNKKNGTTIEKDLDGSLILQETKKDGQFYGERIRVTDKGQHKSTFTENYRKGGERYNFKEERVYTDKKTSVGTSVGKGEVINLDNITKYERSFTEKDFEVSAERIIIEGTVNQKYFKEFNDPSSATGWVKTNLPYLTPTYERYYGMQGQKVTVVEMNGRDQYSSELFIENKYPETIREADQIVEKEIAKGRTATVMEREGDFYVSILENVQEGNNVTVDGEVQALRVKFSKSAANYNKAQNAVKFSKNLTNRQTKRKLLTTLDKLIKNQQQDSFVKSTLVELKQAAELGLDLRDVMMGDVSVSEIIDIDSVIQDVKNMKVDEIRRIGHSAFVKLLDTANTKEVLSFVKNVFRSTRSAGVFDITTNKLLIDNVLDVIQNGKFKGQFTLKETSKDSGNFSLLHNGKKVELYEDVTNIKKNARKDNTLVNTVNQQAEQAQAFILDILGNKDISKGNRIAMLQLMAYDQRGALRKASKMGITLNKDVKLPVSELTLEHEVTIDDTVDTLIDFINEKPGAEQKVNDMFENSYVHVLPKSIDSVLGSVVENGVSYKNKGGLNRYTHPKVLEHLQKLESKNIITLPARLKFSKSNNSQTLNSAIQFSRSANNPTKGITVLDFDDTLATTKSMIRFTRPDGTKGKLNAEQYASTYEDLSNLGYEFDFSEFNKVVDGKTAPLFEKAMKLQGKFGPESMFVLTARPMESAGAIHAFLKANGLNIPLKNITGLANSTAEAKALWMADKVGEGYNDFYFADDALQNVKAVKNMLNQFDVKSKVQQAKVKFSQSMDDQFNDILENITGIESVKRFSIIKGRKRGDSKGKFRVFIPPSHEDFVGLLYNFMGKGREGDKHRNFFEQALVRPLNRAYKEIDTAKQAIANDYKSLNEKFSDVKDKLVKSTPDGDFTFQDAIRVYLWNKHGHKIPGLTETDQAKLTELVQSDPRLQAYAETLNIISKQENYVAPGQAWETANIRIDLVDATGRVGRAKYFTEFNENSDVLFSEENLNKIEAGYGRPLREALEDMLHRIKTGVNRPKGASGKPNMFMNWLNASVSGVMFFNTRSALLQQMSNVNFLNFADNNILAAGKAFANQPQYWKDFAMIFNSDMLKQRRGGLGTDINGAELAEAIKKARPDSMFDQVAIITGKALKLGFLPTQIGDNIAIATGGAAFYRNRVNKYVKDGMSIKEAETAAFTDFQNITQSTQQSARPDMTSQQQASWIGKLVLNFLNTPSQYNRIIKKAGSDILNRRITGPNTTQMQSDMSNMSRILYYGAAQNLIFYSLQTALFAVMFGDEEDEEALLKKKERVINGSIDTILRGSGIYGVAVSTLKNMAIKFMEQREKGYNKDESAVIMEMLNFSPVVGIKTRKVVNAEKTLNYNKKVIEEMETFDIDNPQWSAVTNYVEAITTAPVNRLYQKSINLRNASDSQYTALQRILFLSGYTTWSLNLGDTEKMEKIKQDLKDKKKKTKKRKSIIGKPIIGKRL